MKQGILTIAAFVFLLVRSQGGIVFIENMGNPSGTVSIASNTFQQQGTLTYSGTADVRTTTVSTGYTGASGNGNVFFTTSGNPAFSIGNIDTSLYQAGSFGLTFGAFKSAIAADMTDFKIAYSTDGTNFTNLSFAAQATGSGTSNWRLITVTSAITIPVTTTLTLRWTNTSATNQVRLDDVILTGNLAAIPEPAMGLPLLVGISAVCGLCRRRSRLGRTTARSSSSC